MKGILCACLLVALHTVAQAYEADIHYSTTYALARAAGWSRAEATVIASANQGVDENQDTVAALEMDAAPDPTFGGYAMRTLHQAGKNLALHCFSKTAGDARRISEDVHDVLSARFAGIPARAEAASANSRKLIALGVALHCQQDARAHAGFGGSCGSYAGSCYGHTYETFLDQVVFGLLKKHFYNPDHPGVSGSLVLEALRTTADELVARRPSASSRVLPTRALLALSDALRASGLELPDDVRIRCNRYIAGKWLFDFFRSEGRRSSADAVESLAPEIAVTCRNPSLASAVVVSIPDPRFPRLNADASPYLVRADGSYALVTGGEVAQVPVAKAVARIPDYPVGEARLQLSHWSQLLALPALKQTLRSAEAGR